jgi:Putative prokaryotic signal transducing protein
MKKVFTAPNGTEAHFVRGLLEAAGLVVTVRGEDLWGASGELPFVDVWPTIWVLDDTREAEARAVIEQYEATKDAPAAGEPWRCVCGQDVEPQFTTCWSCGAERPT